MDCEKCKKRITGKYQMISNGELKERKDGNRIIQTQSSTGKTRFFCHEHRLIK